MATQAASNALNRAGYRLGQLKPHTAGRRDQLLAAAGQLAVLTLTDGLDRGELAAWLARQAELAGLNGEAVELTDRLHRIVEQAIDHYRADPSARAAAHAGLELPAGKATGGDPAGGAGSSSVTRPTRQAPGRGRLVRPKLGRPAGSASLADVVAEYRRWFDLPDPTGLYFALGVVQAGRLPGPPPWGFLVGPPGAGKTELLLPFGELADTFMLDTVTAAALLPADGHRDGLLDRLGPFGRLIFSDFGATLEQPSGARAETLALLRKVCDGQADRSGADWRGRVTVLAAATDAIDRRHRVLTELGPRFLVFRLPAGRAQGESAARRALAGLAGREIRRPALAEAVLRLFGDAGPLPPAGNVGALVPAGPPENNWASGSVEADWLLAMAGLAAQARGVVHRDARHDLVGSAEPESPTRLTEGLAMLLRGLRSVGCPEAWCWRTVALTALSCPPGARRLLLRTLATGPARVEELASQVGQPRQTVHRVVEDLALLGVVEFTGARSSRGRTYRYALTAEAGRAMQVAGGLVAGTNPDTGERFDDDGEPLPVPAEERTNPC